MRRAFLAIWAVLLWLFLVMIPIQFYLAGHGAMEGAHATDKGLIGMKTAWDPHSGLGTLMLLVALLALVAALAGQPPRRFLAMTAALFVFMVIQFILPLFNDSTSTRWIAALHGVNALIVTGLAGSLAFRARAYLPFWSGDRTTEAEPSPAGP